MDDDQRRAGLNDEPADDDVESHMKPGRLASDEPATDDGDDADVELHMKRGRD